MKANDCIASEGKYSREKIHVVFGTGFTDHADVGASEMLSALIRETGRVCENYASDVLCFIEGMKRWVEDSILAWNGSDDTHPMNFTSWLGLRKSGANWFTMREDEEDTYGRVEEWKRDRDFIVRLVFQVNFEKNGTVTFFLARYD